MTAASSLNLPRPFGPYELVRQLAVGGMAEVFLARARSVAGFEKVVALKMIHPRFSEDPEFARLLVDEANITAQLSHRNIVQVIDLGQIDGTHYIAMEHVDGLDLARLTAKARERGLRFSPRFAAYIVREVCDGLEHAHRKMGADGKPLKIVHRDVSPPNILISTAGEVKLTDFGIAKAALRASSTEAGVVKGKYAYMPPEQARGQPLDLRADIFSAACVLYELATGQPVYKEAPLPVLLERVTKAMFDQPEKIRPDLPPALIAVMKKSLSANPNDRHQSARAMAEDLSAFLYTLPPNPEMEVSQVLASVMESNRASIPPMAGMSLLDDDSHDSTQIESVASMRQKMLPEDAPKAPPVAASDAAGGFSDEPTRAVRKGQIGARAEEEPAAAFRPSTATPRVGGEPQGVPAAPAPRRSATIVGIGAPTAASPAKSPQPAPSPSLPTSRPLPSAGGPRTPPAQPARPSAPPRPGNPPLPGQRPPPAPPPSPRTSTSPGAPPLPRAPNPMPNPPPSAAPPVARTPTAPPQPYTPPAFAPSAPPAGAQYAQQPAAAFTPASAAPLASPMSPPFAAPTQSASPNAGAPGPTSSPMPSNPFGAPVPAMNFGPPVSQALSPAVPDGVPPPGYAPNASPFPPGVAPSAPMAPAPPVDPDADALRRQRQLVIFAAVFAGIGVLALLAAIIFSR